MTEVETARAQFNEASSEELSLLDEAFRHFKETGDRLEAKYAELLAETHSLREQLRMKDDEIQRNERLATLGKTAAAIAHEVRNPLGAIKLFLSLLRRDISDNPEGLELVERIEAGVTAIDSVVSNILQFSRNGTGSFAPVNVHSLINEEADVCRRMAGEGLNLHINLVGSPFVYGHEHGLRRLFHNLFLNSVQAMNNVGRLAICSTESDDKQLKILVHDSGSGIAEELMPNLFEPFVTTRPEGTGLGLAVVKRIVDQHGGKIDVRNRDGAEFSIILPRVPTTVDEKAGRSNREH